MTDKIIELMAAELMGRVNASEAEIYAAARAVAIVFMAATREPSEAMDEAGENSFQWGGPAGLEWLEAADSTVCWQAMHDKLREEALG